MLQVTKQNPIWPHFSENFTAGQNQTAQCQQHEKISHLLFCFTIITSTLRPKVGHLFTSCSHIWHTRDTGNIRTFSICQDAFYYSCITNEKLNLIAKTYLPFETSDTSTKRSSMLSLPACRPWNYWHTYRLQFQSAEHQLPQICEIPTRR